MEPIAYKKRFQAKMRQLFDRDDKLGLVVTTSETYFADKRRGIKNSHMSSIDERDEEGEVEPEGTVPHNLLSHLHYASLILSLINSLKCLFAQTILCHPHTTQSLTWTCVATGEDSPFFGKPSFATIEEHKGKVET